MRNAILVALALFLSSPLLAQTSISWEDPVAIAPSDFGYTNLRMVLDNGGAPVVLHGKSGANGGLYCTRWNGSGFDGPVAVTSEAGLFINDAEGPRMAVSGERIAVSYQLSGQWANGGRLVLSEDGGTSWDSPIPVAPEATVDHFMPVPAFDGDQQPWVTVKWGPAPVLEGALFWEAASETFSAPVDAGQAMEGEAVCECCASMPFSHDGRNYDIVRNNNDNIRDFWMVRTDGLGNWTEALDIDPTDWNINACPASEAETCILADGTLMVVFMSAGEGGSRVYWSTVDLEEWSLMGSDRIQPGTTHLENNPSVDADGQYSVAAWERNLGGYGIVVAVGSNAASASSEWVSAAVEVTEDLSGHSRRPVVRIHENTVHLVYQRPSEGTVHYRKGTISTEMNLPPLADDEPLGISVLPEGWRVLHRTGFEWTIHDLGGRLVSSGYSTDGTVPFAVRGIHLLSIADKAGVGRVKLAR